MTLAPFPERQGSRELRLSAMWGRSQHKCRLCGSLTQMRLLLAILLAVTVLISPAIASPARETTQLCFDRPGESGSLNILPVSIRIGSNISPESLAVLTIVGEEEVCLKAVYLDSPSRLAVTLRFPRPYWNKVETWTTNPVWIRVTPGETTTVFLCRRDIRLTQNKDDTAWHNIWVLSPPESRGACAKN